MRCDDIDILLKASNLTSEDETRYRRLMMLDPKFKYQLQMLLSARLQRKGIDAYNMPPYEYVETEHYPNSINIGHQKINDKVMIPFGLTVEQLIDGHTLILGSTKSGKSNLLKNILAQIDDNCIVWCFDFLNEYRQLLNVLSKSIVINYEDIRINPIKPSLYLNIQESIQLFTEVYSHSFKVLTGSKSFIHTTLSDLYDICLDKGIYPTLPDYVEYLKNLKLKKIQYSYLPVNLVRFESMLKSIGMMINIQTGYIDELLQSEKHVIIELSGIVEAELQNFIIELLMTTLFTSRKKMKESKKPILLIVDEASRIYDRGKENTAAGLPNIDILTTQNRHSDMYVLAATQEISKVTNSLIANTSRKIIFKQNSGKDIQEISNALILNAEQKEYLQNLEIGQAVVKEGSYPPFLVKTSLFPIKAKITDEIVNNLSAPIIEKLKGLTEPRSDKLAQNLDNNQFDLEKEILLYLCNNPIADTEEILQAVQCNRSRFSRTIDSLIDKGLLKKIKPLHFIKGGGRLLYELTSKARKLLSEWGYNHYHPGKCGLESYFYQKKYIEPFYIEKGFSVKWEGKSGNSTADLIISNNLKCYAIELQLSEKNTINNLIRNNQATGIDNSVIICKDEVVQDKIKKEITNYKNTELGIFSLYLLSDYVIKKDSFSGI